MTEHSQRTNIFDATTNAQTAPKSTKAFGRVVQIHSLRPIITLQLLVCLWDHFDMERLFSTFLSQGTSLGYHPHPGLDFGIRKIWSFSMKYYYLTLGEPEVYSGQTSRTLHEKEKDLCICRGSSSITLRFADDDGDDNHSVSSAATPWRLLILSCNRQSHRRLPTLRNGVEAYLWGINNELAGARRNLRHVADQISSIAVPSVSCRYSP